MKSQLPILIAGALLAVVVSTSEIQSDKTCRLAQLIPKDIIIPDVGHGDVPHTIEDPLGIPNVTVTLDDELIKGTYSLWNGVATGLSTLEHDFSYNPVTSRLLVNATVVQVGVTGDYEIVDGQVNLTTLGHHTISGSGPLNVSASGVDASAGFIFRIHPITQNVRIEQLKLNFTFDGAHVVAENLVVDGEKVDWDVINENLKPTFDAFWAEVQQVATEKIQEKINWLLEGCTLMDLIDIIKPKPKDETE